MILEHNDLCFEPVASQSHARRYGQVITRREATELACEHIEHHDIDQNQI